MNGIDSAHMRNDTRGPYYFLPKLSRSAASSVTVDKVRTCTHEHYDMLRTVQQKTLRVQHHTVVRRSQ